MSLRVEVDLTLQDFRALGKAAHKRAKALPRPESNGWRRLLALGGLWVALVLLGVVVLRSSEGRILDHLPFGVFLALTFSGLFIYFLLDAQRRVYPDAAGTMLGPRSYELTDEGALETSVHHESRMQWSGVKGVVETPDHIFLFVDRCAGFIVPKRFFGSPVDAEEFRAFAEHRLKSERPGT